MRLVPRRIQYSQCSFIHAHVPQHGGPLSEVRGHGAVVSTCRSSIHVPQHLRTARVIARGSSTGRPRTHAVLGGVESKRRGGTGESRGSGGRRHTGRLHASAHHGGTGESRGEPRDPSLRVPSLRLGLRLRAPSLRLGFRHCASGSVIAPRVPSAGSVIAPRAPSAGSVIAPRVPSAGSVIAPRVPSLRLGFRHCASGSGSACASSLLPSASRLRRRPLAETTRAAPGVVGDRPIGGTVPRLSVCSCKPPRGSLRTAGEGPLAGIWSSVP